MRAPQNDKIKDMVGLTPSTIDGKPDDLAARPVYKKLLRKVLHVDDGCASGEGT